MKLTVIKYISLSLVCGMLFQIIKSLSEFKDDIFMTIVGQLAIGVAIGCVMVEKLRQPEKNKN